MTRAAIYVRVSTQGQEVDGTSLDTQAAACHAYAADAGYDVLGVYSDTFTGSRYRERPALSELRALVRTGSVDVVLCHALDRLSRNQAHLYILAEEVEQAGARLAFVVDDFEDSAVGRFIRSAKAFAAEVEREKIAERSLRGRKARASAGRYVPGMKPPYGYRWSEPDHSRLVVHDDEAAVVQRMFRDYVGGGSLRGLAMALTAEGVPTPLGHLNGKTRWTHTSVRLILKHRVYLGDVVSYGVALPAGIAQPLIEPATFEAAQRRLSVNQQRSKRNAKYPDEVALLRGGFGICGLCGATLMVAKYSDGSYSYRCPNPSRGTCMQHRMVTHALDTEVWQRVRWLFRREGTLAQLVEAQAVADPAEELAGIERALASVDRQRENLARAVALADDADTMAVLVGQLEHLAVRRRELEAERTAVAQQAERFGLSQQTALELEVWRARVALNLESMTIAEQRDLLDLLGIRAHLWPQDHEPRWRISSEFLPDFLGTSSPTGSSRGRWPASRHR